MGHEKPRKSPLHCVMEHLGSHLIAHSLALLITTANYIVVFALQTSRTNIHGGGGGGAGASVITS